MRYKRRVSRRVALTFICGAICGALVAACGSSSKPTTNAAKGYSQALEFSKCMRAHGITDFPDPQTGSPPSNPAGYSAVMGVPGAFLAIPNSINPQSPAFKQAAAACNFGPRGGRVPKVI